MRTAPYLVIGAGVHGLSTAWHLAQQGEQVLVVDKTAVAAGASGIACGVVRNNYFQPAMSELMAACVEIWESDPEALAYHGSGYIALGDGAQVDDLTTVHERQQQIGYPSQLILGEAEVAAHMRSLFGDWRAPGLTVCLHERAGGFAYNRDSMLGLASKARAAGAEIEEGVEVTGFDLDASGAVTRVQTSTGPIEVGQVVVAVGPWITRLWEMLELPARLEVAGTERDMWTYWYLQEGEIDVDPAMFATNDGSLPPVVHVDSHAPLHDDDGRLVTAEQWGIYYKRDKHSVQGGASPLPKGPEFELDPYPTGTVEPGFPDLWCAALSHCMARFEGAALALPPDALGRRRRLHRRQLPHLRPHAPERLRGRGLQPRLQDDRGGPRDRPRARRRALGAAAPVPLRALRQRRPAPGLEQPLPLELAHRCPRTSSSAPGSTGCRSPRAWPSAAPTWWCSTRRASAPARRGAPAGSCATTTAPRPSPMVVRMSVEIFESAPEAFGFRQVGYLAAVPEQQVDDLVAIREQHERVGYASELVVGAERCRDYLTWTWPDWEAPVEAILHERRGGWADALQTVRHLAQEARGAGVDIREGVEVVGFERGERGVEAIATSDGRLECETVVVAPGPWIARVWAMLGLDPEVRVDGEPRPAGLLPQGAGGRVRARRRRP